MKVLGYVALSCYTTLNIKPVGCVYLFDFPLRLLLLQCCCILRVTLCYFRHVTLETRSWQDTGRAYLILELDSAGRSGCTVWEIVNGPAAVVRAKPVERNWMLDKWYDEWLGR